MTKSDVRTSIEVLSPQPTKDEDNMWYWKDCQWMDGGLGFPKSGIEDHFQDKVGKPFVFHDETYGIMEGCVEFANVMQLKDLSKEDKDRVYTSGLADSYNEDVWLLLCYISIDKSKILLERNTVTDILSYASDDYLLSLFKDICAFRHTGVAEEGSRLRDFHNTLREHFGRSYNVISLAESEILFEIGRRFYNKHISDSYDNTTEDKEV